ncbi:hypothetical protein RQP46_001255 [Phenoliferia psychrophenolica]
MRIISDTLSHSKNQDNPDTSNIVLSTVSEVSQIESNPKGEYIFWTSGSGDQIRCRGFIHLFPSPSQSDSPTSIETLLPGVDFEMKREKEWQGLGASLRASFLRPTPGSVWPKGKKYEFKERLEIGDEGESEAYERFALVVFECVVVDRSQTNVTRE